MSEKCPICGNPDTANGTRVRGVQCCNECCGDLPWTLAEIAVAGSYRTPTGEHSQLEFIETVTSGGVVLHAGVWCVDNWKTYPTIARRRAKYGADERPRFTPTMGRVEANDDKRRAMDFFFKPDPMYNRDGTLANSPNGREFF